MYTPSITTFNSQTPPWAIAQLDSSLSSLQSGFLAANTFSNYIVDTGAVNAYVAALSGSQTATLTAGLLVQVKIVNTNTGASTINVGATGATAIKNMNGTALNAGQLISGQIYSFQFDGTNYILLGSDYGENTWTPAVGGTATYTTQTGTWTKTGRIITIDMSLVINAIGTGSTTVISGLPFVAASANSVFACRVNVSATAIVSAVGVTTAAAATITLVSRIAANASDGTNAIFQNAASVQLSGSYRI